MDENMDVDMGVQPPQPESVPTQATTEPSVMETDAMSVNTAPAQPNAPAGPSREAIQVKVHIRRPEKDAWVYLGRGMVVQEVNGHSSRVVVRSASTNKIMTSFSENTDLQAEKRGNFVVVGCVDATRVVSWSLNALNNSETLRLLASIELACYKVRQAMADPRLHSKSRRKIERVIKDDKRRRHRRRKDQEALVDAFSKQSLGAGSAGNTGDAGPSEGMTSHTDGIEAS